MKRLLVGSLLLLSAGAFSQNPTEVATRYASEIKPGDLREKLTIIAGAEMQGRETATPGQKRAAAFIENFFRKIGLQPGTPSGYQLPYPVYQDTLLGSSLSVNGQAFRADESYAFNPAGITAGEWKINNIVFAGYGMVDSTHNDYEGLDVKGKWVMVLDGLSNDGAPSSTNGGGGFRRGPGSAFSKGASARSKGAIGMILVTRDFPRKQPMSTKGGMYINRTAATAFPSVSVSPALAAAMLGNSALNSFDALKTASRQTATSTVQFNVAKQTQTLESTDVIGVLPGTDKKDEYVFITGHYDHLGIRNGQIYYGADDDGSGTTGVLELAQTFVKAAKEGHRPRRTMVFMTVSGEEEGLWGSEFYSNNPVFPLDKTSVDLNIDMIGRIDPNYKGDSMNYVYPIGEDKLSSDLKPITDGINSRYVHMELDRRYNDITDPNRFYYRSDHYNFARKGVPIIFYFNGTHADYHRPTDTVDKINFDLMARRAQLVFYTAWVMANRDDMLKRDIPLNIPAR